MDHWGLVKRVLCYVALAMISGCSLQLINPKGDIGVQEKNLIIVASALMLLVVIPVILLTLYFAWKYRETNTKAIYAPKWDHSYGIEVVVWSIPCVNVVILGLMIWKTTHSLDPYKPIESTTPPLRVEVVALNWKWLFIYPDHGVASVNKLAVPVGTPIEFKLTADSIMNSFFIPQLGTQIYAMPAMQTKLHLIADHPGVYRGLSAAYSGPGFSDMHFETVATSREDFDKWVAQAKKAPQKLDKATYAQLAKDSHGYPVTVYNSHEPGLFLDIINKYMGHGPAAGHGGHASAATAAPAAVAAAAPKSTAMHHTTHTVE
jgi:cytochrome o ubiquinol oxidase subunit 2